MEIDGIEVKGAIRMSEIAFGHGLTCEDINILKKFLEMVRELGAPRSVLEFTVPQAAMLEKAIKNCVAAWLDEEHPGSVAKIYGDVDDVPEKLQSWYKNQQHKHDN